MDNADTLPMEQDEATAAILRAPTRILGEDSPSPAQEVLPGKKLPEPPSASGHDSTSLEPAKEVEKEPVHPKPDPPRSCHSQLDQPADQDDNDLERITMLPVNAEAVSKFFGLSKKTIKQDSATIVASSSQQVVEVARASEPPLVAVGQGMAEMPKVAAASPPSDVVEEGPAKTGDAAIGASSTLEGKSGGSAATKGSTEPQGTSRPLLDPPSASMPIVMREAQQAFKAAKKNKRPKDPEAKEHEPAEGDGLPPKAEAGGGRKAQQCKMKRPAACPAKRMKTEPAARNLESEFDSAASDAATKGTAEEGDVPKPKTRQSRKKKADEETSAEVAQNIDGKSSRKAESEEGQLSGKESKKPRKSRASSRPEEEEGLRVLPLGLKKDSGGERCTFAGRPAPKSADANNRFTVMLTTFTSKIAPFITTKSAVEVRGNQKNTFKAYHIPKEHVQVANHGK